MNIKYEKERELLYTYENDLHLWRRSIDAFNSGLCLGPSLDEVHLNNIFSYLKLDLNNKTVLNLGCGHGVTDAKICKKFPNIKSYTGIDFSEKRIERCKEIAEYAGITANYMAVDLNLFLDYNLQRNIKYDVIFAFEVMEHLSNQINVAKNIKACLNAGGYFIGSVPIQDTDAPPKQHIGHFRSEKEVEEKLEVKIINDFKLRLDECRLFVYNK